MYSRFVLPCVLSLVSSDNGQQIVVMQEVTGSGIAGRMEGKFEEKSFTLCRIEAAPEEVGAAPYAVVGEVFDTFLVPEVLQRIRPQHVAHRAEGRRLFEAVDLQPRDFRSKLKTTRSL